jgi:hypothetical protein
MSAPSPHGDSTSLAHSDPTPPPPLARARGQRPTPTDARARGRARADRGSGRKSGSSRPRDPAGRETRPPPRAAWAGAPVPGAHAAHAARTRSSQGMRQVHRRRQRRDGPRPQARRSAMSRGIGHSPRHPTSRHGRPPVRTRARRARPARCPTARRRRRRSRPLRSPRRTPCRRGGSSAASCGRSGRRGYAG